MQITMWGYKDAGHALRQVSFQRYVLINKSGLRIDSMFVSRWSDPDIGRYTDDFVGYDSDLQLGYAYNSDSVDVEFQAYGLTPPAAGYALLQGPIVPSPDDTANFRFHKLPGYQNLPVTSFGYVSVGAPINPPPYGDYDGTLEWYNLLNGFRPTTDTLNPTPYTHGAGPQAGQATRFPLNGDPLLGTGDIDGAGNNFPPGDRQFALCSGPFTMMPGDAQEIVLMIGAGITDDYLTAINALKSYVPAAREMYESLIQAPVVGIADPAPLAAAFELEQNYPNPFNPVTVIGYQLSVVSEVRLVVYNLLGQTIRTLVDARQAPGAYEVQWDGRDGQGMALGSGIYFYRLKVGNFAENRKMVLLK
ncbi:MAG: T9SS type A sorting domain-containing protein [Leptospiraceae bacterium]|nr:T9SS type A sorting domain-containing protein [Leptospiraceae bacterium]